jgi:hypothetical protein
MPLPWFAFGLPGVAVLFGGAFAYKGLSFLREAHACSRWPTAPGRILKGAVETRVFEDENDPKKETEFSGFNVLYTYHVGGREYRSTRLYVGNPVLRGGDRIARALAAKYQVGKAVPVYYNPANPAIAMLEPLNRSNATLAAIMATGFGGMGLFMAYVMAMAQ